MTIDIHSRASMMQLIDWGFPPHTAVISFYPPASQEPPLDYSALTDRVFRIALQPLEIDQLAMHGLTYETYFNEDEALAEFVFAAIRDGYDILCQCEDGCRVSAGCAAALREYFTSDGILIFADYRYHPNQMIFHKVYNALWIAGKQ